MDGSQRQVSLRQRDLDTHAVVDGGDTSPREHPFGQNQAGVTPASTAGGLKVALAESHPEGETNHLQCPSDGDSLRDFYLLSIDRDADGLPGLLVLHHLPGLIRAAVEASLTANAIFWAEADNELVAQSAAGTYIFIDLGDKESVFHILSVTHRTLSIF
jgi:hypothetical protein